MSEPKVEQDRCTACEPCPSGVISCDREEHPHGHGGAQPCEECGIPFYRVHPHSPWCSKAPSKMKETCHDHDWYTSFYPTRISYIMRTGQEVKMDQVNVSHRIWLALNDDERHDVLDRVFWKGESYIDGDMYEDFFVDEMVRMLDEGTIVIPLRTIADMYPIAKKALDEQGVKY